VNSSGSVKCVRRTKKVVDAGLGNDRRGGTSRLVPEFEKGTVPGREDDDQVD